MIQTKNDRLKRVHKVSQDLMDEMVDLLDPYIEQCVEELLSDNEEDFEDLTEDEQTEVKDIVRGMVWDYPQGAMARSMEITKE